LTKSFIKQEDVVSTVTELMTTIQENLFEKAKRFRDEHITEVDTFDEFKKTLKEKGGFISAHWDGTAATEDKIKKSTKATIRCIPFEGKKEPGKCVLSGAPSAQRVLFAKAY